LASPTPTFLDREGGGERNGPLLEKRAYCHVGVARSFQGRQKRGLIQDGLAQQRRGVDPRLLIVEDGLTSRPARLVELPAEGRPILGGQFLSGERQAADLRRSGASEPDNGRAAPRAAKGPTAIFSFSAAFVEVRIGLDFVSVRV
jgi:hypothetical protein